MVNKDGGPAFPTEKTGQLYGSDGMSLRDWFAGQATDEDVAAFTEHYVKHNKDCWTPRAVARYRFADAMLEARNVR